MLQPRLRFPPRRCETWGCTIRDVPKGDTDTEAEMATRLGYTRFYDCGKTT